MSPASPNSNRVTSDEGGEVVLGPQELPRGLACRTPGRLMTHGPAEKTQQEDGGFLVNVTGGHESPNTQVSTESP